MKLYMLEMAKVNVNFLDLGVETETYQTSRQRLSKKTYKDKEDIMQEYFFPHNKIFGKLCTYLINLESGISKH